MRWVQYTVEILVVLALLLGVVFGARYVLHTVTTIEYVSGTAAVSEVTHIEGPRVTHVKMPSEVRALYMTACYGARKDLRERIVQRTTSTKLNAIVIDIKDYTGTISIPVRDHTLQLGAGGKGCKIDDIKEFIEYLHNKDIYVIGRITVFQDPLYAKHHTELAVHRASNHSAVWHDHKGLAFIDVGAKQYWKYIVTLAKEAYYDIGFDELNFDYVRYPSDGNMADTYFSHSGGVRSAVDMQDELEKFFIYLNHELKRRVRQGVEPPTISADFFGMVTTNHDDLTIGQVLERALPYFDAIAPMVYPSHYPASFLGLGNPNKHVYKVVHYSMSKAVERTRATSTNIASHAYSRRGTSTPPVYTKPAYSQAKLRPWLQDFDYGGDYGPREVSDQIRASRDAGVTGGYMLWSPSNRYTHGVAY